MPTDVFGEEFEGEIDYTPVYTTRSGPDPEAVKNAAKVLISKTARHLRRTRRALRGSLAAIEGTSALDGLARDNEPRGKSAFPENHPLSLGSGGSMPRTVHEFLQNSDVIFGIGCSFTSTNFGVTMPKGKTIVHATLDPMDLNKNQVASTLWSAMRRSRSTH